MLTPVFDLATHNSDVLLAEGEAIVVITNVSYTSFASAELKLFPSPRIIFRASFDNLDEQLLFKLSFGSAEISSFSFDGQKIPGLCLHLKPHLSESKIDIVWAPSEEPLELFSSTDHSSAYLIFHLMNFKELVRPNLELESENWKISLSSINHTEENFKFLNDKGGYGLTHVGKIEKVDGRIINVVEASDMLKLLRYFFSFAKGIWCSPICSVGFGTNNVKSCVWLNAPEQAWHVPVSWFDEQHTEHLCDLFPGFLRKWNDKNWRSALREAIYWYVNANYSPRGIDAGIILTQTALERLSFEYSVKDRQLVELQGFKDLRASDQFRLLFSSLELPIELPLALKDLSHLAKTFNWIDCPHAITEVRNSLVHPTHKNRHKFYQAYIDAWQLGLWYLELSILRLCDYDSTYRNRLTLGRVGVVQQLPRRSS